MNRYITGFFAATLAALMLSGCACKLVNPLLERQAEHIDNNADYFVKQAEAGKPIDPVTAKEFKALTEEHHELAKKGLE